MTVKAFAAVRRTGERTEHALLASLVDVWEAANEAERAALPFDRAGASAAERFAEVARLVEAGRMEEARELANDAVVERVATTGPPVAAGFGARARHGAPSDRGELARRMWATSLACREEAGSVATLEAAAALAALAGFMGIADADRTAWERSIEGGRPRSRLDAFFDGTDIAEIRAALAASRSPDTRERDRSFGRVRSPETRNGRTGKPEHGGLECCRIFGPVDEDQCLCGAQRGGGICSKCGVECGDPSVRDWRFGHIALPRAVLHPAAVGRAAVQLGIAEDALRAALQRELGPFGTRLQGGGGERLADLPEGCTIDLVPVPPPGDRPDALRLGADGSLVRHAHPMVGALRRVVNLSNRLQRLIELNAPDVILDNEHDFLQQAVFDLVEGREAVVAVEPLAVDGIALGDREAWFGPGEACEAALLWLADGVLVQEATGLRLLGPDGETRATWPPHLCRIAYAMGRYVVALGPYPAVDDGTVLDVAVLDLDSGWLDTWPDGLPCRLVQHEQPEEAFLVDALAGTRVRVGTWSDRPTAEAWAPDGSLCWMSDAGYGGALVDVAGNVLRTLRLDEDPEWSFDAATSEVRPIAEHRPYDVRAGVQAAVGACGTAGPRPDWHVAGPDGLVGALDLARLRVIGPFRAFAFALDGARLAVLGPDCVWVVRLEERGPPVVEGRL